MAILGRSTLALAAFALVNLVTADRYPDCVSGPLSKNDVCNSSLDPATRAAALVKALNITEKLAGLRDQSPGAPRLGLPSYEWWNEALHGVASSRGVNFSDSGEFSYATSFPIPMTISAAFDDDLVEKIGLTIGAEGRAFGNANRSGIDFWTPNINPFRDPRWGRGLETPGEDPRRTSNYVKHFLQGMEWASQDPKTQTSRQVVGTCKHFAAYDLENWNGTVRFAFDAQVSLQDLVEYYLPPFRQCARDSNVGSMMCSYNAVNGVPSCANEYLLQTVVREHWNWTAHNNYFVSDCAAVEDILFGHKYVNSSAQSAAAAFNAGTDNACELNYMDADFLGAYNQSLLSEKIIDQSLRRLYEGLIRADYFSTSGDVGYRAYGWDKVYTKEAQTLARGSAVDGTVLLKNDGILPYSFKKDQKVALVGFWANDTTQRMLANYHGNPPVYVTPLMAAQQLDLDTNHAGGPVAESNFTISTVLDAAKDSDIILYFGGIDNTIEAEDIDRNTTTWPSAQLDLLDKLSSQGKPVVVVQLGSSLDNTPLLNNKNINAIMWTGYPGMFGGAAVFDIITGAKAPAGRLPITQYPAEYVDQVPMTDMTLRPGANNPGRTYKWYNGAVQPYGFGLHYTNFTIEFGAPYNTQNSTTIFQSKTLLAACTEPHKDLCAFPSFPITVTNHGNVTSDFVALAFMSTTAGPTPHPLKELASYARLRDITPGEVRKADLALTFGVFARTTEKGDTVLYEGTYCLSLDVPEQQNTCFDIRGDQVVFDEWPQPGPNGEGQAS